ncbi:ABC transporter ATP-binding protein [Bacillus sp. 03113]|uniref:ABC transporter ATP-binding protein n=1 Tax=Bacillus sp. 03113 TaxID=2578211 RepID=UPI001142D9C7|nr:ABC transporter ATP-binding protein [Bacillus sp. 03113]
MLEVENVSKKFDGFLLDELSFSLPRGYIMGYIGPNGSGKSTTIRMILNLIKKDHGQIRLFGKDHIEHEVEAKQKIGYVCDEGRYYETLSCEQMKKMIAPFYKKWDEKLYQDYVKKFQLPTNKKIKDLSKGMKMKYSIALALSHHPELVIMDEPTSGLDPIIRSEVLDILKEFVMDEKKSILFSTHITSDLEKVADFITFIQEGKLIYSGTKDDMLEHYLLVKGDVTSLNDANQSLFTGINKNQFGFSGLATNRKKVIEHFGNQVLIEKPSIEDIMLYTKKGA